MEDDYNEYILQNLIYPYQPEKNDFYNENNKSEDQKFVSIGENHVSNKVSSEKNFLNEKLVNNYPNNLYNIDDINNVEKNSDNKFNINDGLSLNPDVLQYNNNNKIEQPNLNRENFTSQYNTVNGKQIITTNDMISNKLHEIYGTQEINLNNLKNMQYLKVKRKRRKKIEIERDKLNNKEENVNKKRGRIKKGFKKIENQKVNHSKESDDNIIKKINSFYIEEIRKWLNKSFLNEKLSAFQSEKARAKKGCFMKLSPKLISTKIKKNIVLKILNTKLKDIFLTNEISSKYTNVKLDANKKLIDKIYQDNNQHFVIFILEMTFLDGLNYFNGQITDDQIINYFKNNFNFSEKMLKQFVNNFGKIEKLIEKVYIDGKKNGEDTKEYVARINVLCLNYKESFENKCDRRENLNNKKMKNDLEINENSKNSKEGK